VGLKDSIKDHWIDSVPGELKELVEEPIKIDARIHERRMEKGGGGWNPIHFSGGRNIYRSGNPHDNGSYGDPMDLSMMQHGRTSCPKQKADSRKDQQTKRRGTDVDGTTCATVVVNPDIGLENAERKP
jgi:hypothetical protein